MIDTENLKKIQFHIIGFTSEDPNYPVTELLQQNPNARGWQSQRFCDYPQEIILQLSTPARIKLLQLMSHQCKISSKIEIFTFMPREPMSEAVVQYALNPNEIHFKKVGYFFFNSNDGSNFQSRELKSVYFNSVCAYIKLVFRKCHMNHLNIFNQVGLIALSIFGLPIDLSQDNVQIREVTEREVYNDLEQEVRYDKQTLDMLRLLEKAREKAEIHEDYHEAKRINEAILDLKKVGGQLQKLVERKVIAVKNKDYESATVLKNEIENLKRVLFPAPKPQIPTYNRNNNLHYPFTNEGSKVSKERSSLPNIQPRYINNKQAGENSPPENSSSYGKTKNYTEVDEVMGGESRRRNNPGNGNEERRGGNISHRKSENLDLDRIRPRQPVNFDEMVIPALRNKKSFDVPESQDVTVKEDVYLEAEEIREQVQSRASPLIPYLSEEVTKAIFSKKWKCREGGLKKIMKDLGDKGNGKDTKLDFSEETSLFVAILGAVGLTIDDKVSKVGDISMKTLKGSISVLKTEEEIYNPEYRNYLNKVLIGLSVKIGDSKPTVRSLAEEVLFSLTSFKPIGCKTISNQMLKSKGVPKVLNDFKHTAARLNILIKISIELGINESNLPIGRTLDFAAYHLENSNPEVRQAAHVLIVEFMKALGPHEVSPMLEGIRRNQLDMLFDDYENQMGQGEPERKKTNRSDRSRSKSKSRVSFKEDLKEDEEDDF